MEMQKNDALRKVLKHAETTGLSADFTATVMQEIKAGQQETVVNPVLGKILLKHGLEAAPPDFSRSIMSRLQKSAYPVQDKPIISRMTGFAIAAIAMLSIFLLSLSAEQHAYSTSKNNYYTIILSLRGIPPVYIFTLFVSAALLLTDFLFTQSHIMKTTGRST